MKLSKNRLHKIKLKRNASRKKYSLRKKAGKYENSRKKNTRNNHLKIRTMKKYVGGVDSVNSVNSVTSPESKKNIIPPEEIESVFRALSGGRKTISLQDFFKFLLNKENPDSIRFRNSIGFDEPFTNHQLLRGLNSITEKDKAVLAKLPKNSQIIMSLFKTYSDPNQTFETFLDFVNCGQYRDKKENIFDCKTVKIPTSENNSSTSQSTSDNNSESGVQYSAIADSLKQYDCEPGNIDITIPDNIKEAENKLHDIENSIMLCPEGKQKALLGLLYFLTSEFKKKFGKEPDSNPIDDTWIPIDATWKHLFVGKTNYENVPDEQDLAEKKLGEYLELYSKCKETNNGTCQSSIDTALNIYMDNFYEKFPDEIDGIPIKSTDNTTSSESSSDTPSTSSGSENNIIPPEKIKSVFTTLLGDTGKKTISLPKFFKFFLNKENPDSVLFRKSIGFDEPLTISELVKGKDAKNKEVLNTLSKNSQIFNSLLKTYSEMPSQSQLGGADEARPGDVETDGTELTIGSFLKFVNCGQYRDKNKNIFDCKTVKIPNSYDNSFTSRSTSRSTSGSTPGSTYGPGTVSRYETDSESGTAAGTISDSEPTASVLGTPAEPAYETATVVGTAAGTEPGTEPGPASGTEQSRDLDGNIEVEINETDFNTDLKRVNVDIFIPRNAQVIVRNYAKNTATETLDGISSLGV
jgi:hypothetical protein